MYIIIVAAVVFVTVANRPSNIFALNLLRSSVSRIATCRYEQIAVASARPAVPMNHIKVRFKTIFTATAITAVVAGGFESCIE